jgi:predicted alpha/beta superfamily hydrolase
MKYLLTISAVFFYVISFGQLPKVVTGSIQRIDSFQSKYITKRNIDIWLPAGYEKGKKYAVIYMHDGQMLFDANNTWNHTSWDVDDVITKLYSTNQMPQTIVVGIWNGGATRHTDYFPQKPFEALTSEQQQNIYKAARANGYSVFNNRMIQSDAYLQFIVRELKPYIDSAYSTYKDAQHTFIGGSSMGGLISMYAICEYPSIFGGAFCMSTHWPGIFSMKDNPIPNAFYNYLSAHLPSPKNHKIYFDHGTLTLDSLYAPLQKQVDSVMRKKGYRANSWITLQFEGADHSERSWNKRLDQPLTFLFTSQKQK